jgi:Adenylate and Guanylate cyclase catalytic domain
VLLASAATLQIYYLSNYTSTYPAVPLSVALATAWAAGHRRWSLLIATWFVVGPLAYAVSQLSAQTEPPLPLLGEAVTNAAMLAAVLVLGEAVRSRRALRVEHEKSERLLLNVLPAPIATRLKAGGEVIADAFPDVTVLFADLVDFTQRSQRISPAQVVAVLKELFSVFDRLAQRHGLEKIKTIGDAYMVAGGLPDPRPDYAEAVAEMALAIRDEVGGRVDPSGQPLQVRIGIDPALSKPGDRDQQVQLRPVGRHRQHRQPHGIPWGRRLNPGNCPHLPAAAGRLPLPVTGIDPRQGHGRDGHLLPGRKEPMIGRAPAIRGTTLSPGTEPAAQWAR